MPPTWSVLLLTLAAAPTVAAGLPGIVTRDGAKLMLDGREYRAVGVNIPHLHQIHNGTWFHLAEKYGTPAKARAVAIEALDDAARSGLAFVRFFASPGYPRDQAALYDKDRESYWRQMDELFALCQARGLRLVPSLQSIPGPYQALGETGRAILDPTSKTYAWVRTYVREFVTRYRESPTVLMWELLNEGMLKADVEMQGRKLLPLGVFPPGAEPRLDGTNEDSLSYGDLQRLYREQTAFIKSLDPNHLVTSGDAHVRPECTSRRETFPNFRFRADTWSEWLANNLASQPEPLDVYSYHCYGSDAVASGKEPWAGRDTLGMMRGLVRATHATDRPIFIGELGAQPSNAADPKGAWLTKCFESMDTEGVSLMALWVWHFNWQPEHTMTRATYPEVVAAAGAFNKRHGSAP